MFLACRPLISKCVVWVTDLPLNVVKDLHTFQQPKYKMTQMLFFFKLVKVVEDQLRQERNTEKVQYSKGHNAIISSAF